MKKVYHVLREVSKRIVMKVIDFLAAVMLVLGGLNWGLVGAFDLDLISTILGPGSFISRIIYLLIGLSALWQALQWRDIQARWCNLR